MGVDSVKVTLKGASGVAYTDTSGRFQLESGPSALRAGRAVRANVVWRAAARAVEWTAGVGPVTVEIRDSKGTLIRRSESRGGEAGRLEVTPPGKGVYFADVRAGGRRLAWQWWELEGSANRAPGGTRDAVYSLGGPSLAKSAAEGDTLIFERRGFEMGRMAVGATSSGLEFKMKRTPIKLLIIDGASNHDWKQMTKVLKALLNKAGFFTVTVSTAPSASPTQAPDSWNAWNPPIAENEIVILNYNSGDNINSPRWLRKQEQALEAFVSGGGGLYILHSANNGFPKWEEFNKMIGTGWRASNFGFALEVGSDLKVIRIPAGTGSGTNHGNRINTHINILNPHPIHKGYPKKYMTAILEIYYYARGPAENCTVLSYAYDSPEAGGTRKNWPIELMLDYGKGRVYNSTPGHLWPGESVPPAIKDLSWQTTLVRASEWLARKEVFYPVPTPFNTETKIESRDIVLQ